LFTGIASYANSPLKRYFESLSEKINITKYTVTGRIPYSETVESALLELKNIKPDLIVATGGGKVIDFSKLVNIFKKNPMEFKKSNTDASNLDCAAPMVLIPTTSGSGSEATGFVALYKNSLKYSIVCPQFRINYVIIDPALTYTLPPRETAVSGMDALCQAFESIWAKSATTESINYAKRALRYIHPNIEKAVLDPDKTSREAMAMGAFYAGKAINISKTTGPHALSYYLMEKKGIPHGEAVAMNLELFIELNFPNLADSIRQEYYSLFNVQDSKQLISEIRRIKKAIGLRNDIRDAGIITREQLTDYIKKINSERMSNNPFNVESSLLYEKLLLCIK